MFCGCVFVTFTSLLNLATVTYGGTTHFDGQSLLTQDTNDLEQTCPVFPVQVGGKGEG